MSQAQALTAAPGIPKDYYEVDVTVTVRIGRTGPHATLKGEMDDVVNALLFGLRKKLSMKKYPRGTVGLGAIEGRALDRRALRRRWTRRQQRSA